MENHSSVSVSAITWKDIEKAQIKVIEEAFRARCKKDSKIVLEYAGYVRNLRQEENPDEYIRSTATMIFPNEDAYNKRMERYRKWYKHKKELLASIEYLYSLYYELSKEVLPMSEKEINEAIEDVIKAENILTY